MPRVNQMFAGSGDPADPRFESSRLNRNVKVFRKQDGNWIQGLIQEPLHNSIKLYSSIRGLPAGTPSTLDLGDLGLVEDHVVNGVPVPAAEQRLPSQLKFGGLCGGSWVNDLELPADSTRIAFAMYSAGDRNWSVLLTTCGFFSGHGEIDVGALTALLTSVATDLDAADAMMILPVLEPKRISTHKGIVFCG